MEAILKALQSIERPGNFATAGVIEPCFLGLEITGAGLIGLPINENQAQAIIKQCYQAPYGRGEATLLDTSVRCTWQLEPQRVGCISESVMHRFDMGKVYDAALIHPTS